ncbi:Septum formation protein Maf [Bifidobacterium actinocoloniiforme DSM 22766]|uniref:Nucleoside triphosphate pyrophosphatase n=1 Tax=Bifidobacterium actinocoloniiforme DSM 22766 TaxID=1437605 RepID=A0A086YVS6_9BIFI|nr:Maf family nucleotide pyrophosphatase [Bifidobacterium actinocoloniiforme]AKV54966.1 septum formation protein Maf [Bifidobacterium actinocoloniiforme DSM 22766]KFI38376.1 Septum formation protein Maf [Bifidobacterium actinocoloniiforme DSM 22766]
MTIPVILASQSPSRRDLLLRAGIRPTIRVSQVDESAALKTAASERGVSLHFLPARERVTILAGAKAGAVQERLQAVIETESRARGEQLLSRPLDEGYGSIHSRQPMQQAVAAGQGMLNAAAGPLIIGCDSLFEFQGEALGKPHTPERALERLKAMRGETGTLWTSHCLIDLASGRRVQASSEAQVTFGDYTDADMAAYVATGEPLEVAGSFTLEGLGSAFIASIQGDPSGVMGLSLPTMRSLVESLGFKWSDLWNEREDRERQQAVHPETAKVPDGNIHQPGDGWVDCACGRLHWGLNGAAGVLLARRDPQTGLVSQVLLQHRAAWSAEGGTWGVPGGAIADGESPVEGALRESHEEANIHPEDIDVIGSYVEDHGPWAYTTVFATEREGHQVEPRVNDDESLELAWVSLDQVADRELLEAFGRDWPAFMERLQALPPVR